MDAMVQDGFIVSHRLESYQQMDDPLVYGVVKKNTLDPDAILFYSSSLCHRRRQQQQQHRVRTELFLFHTRVYEGFGC